MCAKYCDGMAQFSATISSYTVFTVTWDEQTGQVSVSSNPQISVSSYDIQGCSFPSSIITNMI